MVEPSRLGERLSEIREEHGLSLLAIKKAGGPDPSYTSRIEHGKTNPKAANVAKLARAIAAAKGWSLHRLWEVMDDLFKEAGLAAPEKPTEAMIRNKFRQLLQQRQLTEEQIEATMTQASLVGMLQVLEGDDILEIRPVQDFPLHTNKHRETIVLPDKQQAFPAGPRATLHVNGDLTPSKREQLKLMARLVEKILAG
jgi:predicted transcriptional regulator